MSTAGSTLHDRLHTSLLNKAHHDHRQASRNASKYTEDGRFDDKKATQFPALESTILVKATEALEAWREDALAMATQLVQMEEDYVTAAFFRHAVNERLRQLQYANDAVQQLAEGGRRPTRAAPRLHASAGLAVWSRQALRIPWRAEGSSATPRITMTLRERKQAC